MKNIIGVKINSRLLAVVPICFISIILVLFTFINSAKAAVTLLYFRAVYDNGTVILRWETSSERDNSGFQLTRKAEGETSYKNIGEFIVTQGDAHTGYPYEYIDEDIEPGIIYWYILETYNLSGYPDRPPDDRIYGPISWVPTPTPTATRTTTVTPTTTKTSYIKRTATPTATKTSKSGSIPARKTPTSTISFLYPPPATNPGQTNLFGGTNATGTSLTTQPPTSTLDQAAIDATMTQSIIEGGTPTLVPLPSITIIFPRTTTPVNTAQSIASSDENNNSRRSWFTPQRLAIAAIIMVIWVILGGWFLYSFRRLE